MICNYLKNIKKVCIIKIGNKHTELYVVTNATLPSKAKCSVFIYSLLVQIMYITVKRGMFIVVEIINHMIMIFSFLKTPKKSLKQLEKENKKTLYFTEILKYGKNLTNYCKKTNLYI